MKKLVIGGVAVVLLAAAGYFGVTLWAQQRAEREVAATLEMVRQAGGQASTGKIDFDLWSRTLTVADLSIQPAGAPEAAFKAQRVVATGVGNPKPGHISAQRIEVSNFEGAIAMSAPAGPQMRYQAPSVTFEDYSGPAVPLRRVDSSSAMDVTRLLLEQFVATKTTAVTLPTLTMSFTPPKAAAAQPMPPIDYVYSDIAVRDIKDGRIATASVGKTSFTSKAPTGNAAQITGTLEQVATRDVDIGASLALFDPARAKDDRALRIYGQISTGAYTAEIGNGMRMRIDAMSMEEIGFVPSKLPLSEIADFVMLVPPPGTQPSPAEARVFLDKMATLYEGLSLAKFEMRGLSMNTPDGDFKLGAIRLNGLAGGRFAEFAFEGFDSETKQKQPVRVGRFALKGLDVSNLLRASSQLESLAQQSDPDRILEFLKLLEGAELKDLVAPYEQSDKPIQIETVSLSWGQFVGSFPTRMNLTAKMTGPIDMTDQEPFQLLAAIGITRATIAMDLGANWTEGSRNFAIAPAALEVTSLFATSAKVNFGNVSRDVFSLDPVKVMQAAAGIEAGAIELSLRDTGGLDLAIQQYAEAKALSRSAAQTELVDELNQNAAVFSQISPELAPVFAAAAKFLAAPNQTLTVKITPNGRVQVMELLALSPEEALGALSRFTVEASVSK